MKVFASFVKTCIIPINVYVFPVCYSALFQNLKLSGTGVALASRVRGSAMLILLNVGN
jgi:hypothetical protein